MNSIMVFPYVQPTCLPFEPRVVIKLSRVDIAKLELELNLIKNLKFELNSNLVELFFQMFETQLK